MLIMLWRKAVKQFVMVVQKQAAHLSKKQIDSLAMKPHLPLSLRSALLAAVSAAGFLTGTTQLTQAATVSYVDYTISHELIHNPTTAPSEGVEYEECGAIINDDIRCCVRLRIRW